MLLVVLLVTKAIQLYIMLIFVWTLGSWFPQWRYQPWFKLINDVVEPYIRLFRSLPLRVGMLDLTPMAAVFALILFQQLLLAVISGGGYR
jgi:YggT family protein